jgi:pyruvate/2-oxoglutarate dehydrogenase complex dihydrolipoamide acyltransferase (E2) component
MAEASLQPQLEPEQEERRKKTKWLMIAGAASLLLPLAGAVYMHWSDTAGTDGSNMRSDMFEAHDGRGPLVPSQTVSAGQSMVGSGKAVSSLDFIKAGEEFKSHAPAMPAASTATAPVAAPVAAPAPAAPAAQAAANGKKQFFMPKLRTTGTNFKSWLPSIPTSGTSSAGAAGTPTVAGAVPGAAGAAGTAQNAKKTLQGLPPAAANDPNVQKLLQQQQH